MINSILNKSFSKNMAPLAALKVKHLIISCSPPGYVFSLSYYGDHTR